MAYGMGKLLRSLTQLPLNADVYVQNWPSGVLENCWLVKLLGKQLEQKFSNWGTSLCPFTFKEQGRARAATWPPRAYHCLPQRPWGGGRGAPWIPLQGSPCIQEKRIATHFRFRSCNPLVFFSPLFSQYFFSLSGHKAEPCRGICGTP